ncbi:MAG: hypothetical protein IH582_01530, partial [Afipia sp.]|nr:hypothetical protein [Afipia sp.]
MKQVQDFEASAEPVPVSAVDILAQDLRRRILSGAFQPGEFLRDARMSTALTGTGSALASKSWTCFMGLV